MNELRAPNYMLLDSSGRLTHILCKVCGEVTAEVRGNGMYYFPIHTEIKIRFGPVKQPTGFHVTCICIRCAHKATRNLSLINALYDADITSLHEALPSTATLNRDKRTEAKIIAVETKQRGLP